MPARKCSDIKAGKGVPDPFRPERDPMVTIAHAALPILVDRLGGSVTVSQRELAQLSERYGGTVGVNAAQVEEGVYRLTLVPMRAKPDPDRPVS